MAHEPCSACGQQFFGRSVLAYPALLLGDNPRRSRVRLCQGCAATYVANCEQWLFPLVDGNYSQVTANAVCRFCGLKDLPNGTAWVFVTMYPKRNERKDFGGLACPDCAGRAAKEVLVDAS